MNSVLILCIATLALVLLQAFAGRRMRLSGKPYKGLLVAAHVVLAIGVLVGVSRINVLVQQANPADKLAVITMAAAGICWWLSILTGIFLAALKKRHAILSHTHRVAMGVIALALALNTGIALLHR